MVPLTVMDPVDNNARGLGPRTSIVALLPIVMEEKSRMATVPLPPGTDAVVPPLVFATRPLKVLVDAV
jgi:hypothetical protein